MVRSPSDEFGKVCRSKGGFKYKQRMQNAKKDCVYLVKDLKILAWFSMPF